MGPDGAEAYTQRRDSFCLFIFCIGNEKTKAPTWSQNIQGQLMTQATRGAAVASGNAVGTTEVLYRGDSALAPVTAWQGPFRKTETTPVILTESV